MLLINYSWFELTQWQKKNTTCNDRYVHIFKNEQNLLRSVICSGGRIYCIKLSKSTCSFYIDLKNSFELWIHDIFIFRSAAVCIDKCTCLKYHFKRSSELFNTCTPLGKKLTWIEKIVGLWVHITSITSFTLCLKNVR